MDFRKIILLKGNPMLTSKKYADALNSAFRDIQKQKSEIPQYENSPAFL